MIRVGLTTLLCFLVFPAVAVAAGNVVPDFGEAPYTHGSAHLVHSAEVVSPWKWHSRLTGRWMTPVGAARRASQLRMDGALGMGLPGRLELGVGLPMGVTLGRTEGFGQTGGGLGDLRASLLWAAKPASQGGLSILLGASLLMPTGSNEHLMGEGGLSFAPFVSMVLNVFGADLFLNLGYHLRPEHVNRVEERRVEQDDDVTWGVGVRVAREGDLRFSLESRGTIGIQTADGPWPGVEGRPVWIGGGIDVPLERRWLGFVCAALLGGHGPGFLAGVRFSAIAGSRDGDRDGVKGRRDKCPMMKEDLDGFEDGDGCPDLDNDGDGFPDVEDACPFRKGGSFSEDGC